MKKKGISVIALTSRNAAMDKNVWKNVREGVYSVVLALPEIFFQPTLMFWLSVMRDKSNAFCRKLACIAVDEAYLMWGWREFRKEFSNVGILRLVFPKVPIMAVSATMTPNTLEYVRKTLNLKTPVRLYRRPLDRPNITYTVAPITNSGFEDLNFLIPSKISSIGNIEKTMIFVDSVEKGIALGIHLRALLPDNLKDRGHDIIRSFSSVLEAKTKTDWLKAFLNGDTRIIIYMDAVGMGVDIPDIKRVIQWTIVDHSTLATVLQQIGRAARRIKIQAVAVVFVESKHILPKDMTHAVEEYSFACLLVAKGEKNETEEIISSMYKDNMQIRKEGDLSAFHKVDPPLLWFLNTIGCRRRLVLACFADDSAYGRFAPDISYCDNFLYSSYESANVEEDSGVPEWELYDVTMRHSLRYLETNEWYRHQEDIAIAKEIDIRTARLALKESEKVHEHSQALQAGTAAERAVIVKRRMEDCEKACRKALDTFAIGIWPDGMDDIMFPYKWRAKLAKRGIFIKSSTDLIKALKADCDLTASGIQEYIPLILQVILLAVENEDRRTEIDTRQNLVIVSGENVTPQQNNLRRPKRKRDNEDEVSHAARLEKIRTQATKAVVKKVKTAAEKAQSTKVKKVATTQDNVKRTLIKKKDKGISKRGELNETPNIRTATQGDEGRTQSPD